MDKKDYSELNDEVQSVKEPKETVSLFKKYEELLKGENRKTINILGKQGELLKRFKESDEFFSRLDLSRSNIYFKICLYKFPTLKKSTLTSSYFKSNFKFITKVCKGNADIFAEKK